MSEATEMMQRQDIRYMRALSVAHAIMQAIDPLLEWDNRRRVHDAVIGVLMEKGVEVVTDYDRDRYGLPPRGPDGWTAQEIHAIEAARLALLYRPMQMPMSGLTFTDPSLEQPNKEAGR